MADDNSFSSDLSDSESSWEDQVRVAQSLSYEENVAGNEHKQLKEQLKNTVEKYDIRDIPDIEEVLKKSFVDSSKSYLPSWGGYAILFSGSNQNSGHINDVGESLRRYGVEVAVIPNSSRKQLIKSLLCLVFYATINESHVPVIIGYCGCVRGLQLQLSDGNLNLQLIFDLLLHLPPGEIVIPVIEGVDPDVRISLYNDFFSKLQDQKRPFICCQADRNGDRSIFSHLSKELKSPNDLATILKLYNNGHPENVKSPPTTKAIHLSDTNSNEPEHYSCGCQEKCTAGYIICDGGRCKSPDEHTSVPVLPRQGSDDIDNNLRQGETQKILRAIRFLVEKFCYSLLPIHQPTLVLTIRAFFPLLKEMTSASDDLKCSKIDLVDRLCYYIICRAEWISKDRLKQFVEDIGCHKARECLEKIELWIDKLTDVDRLVRAESISYPPHCHRTSMEHYLFVVDEEIARLPFSAFYPLHCRVQEKICRRRQAHVFVSFSTFV